MSLMREVIRFDDKLTFKIHFTPNPMAEEPQAPDSEDGNGYDIQSPAASTSDSNLGPAHKHTKKHSGKHSGLSTPMPSGRAPPGHRDSAKDGDERGESSESDEEDGDGEGAEDRDVQSVVTITVSLHTYHVCLVTLTDNNLRVVF